MFIMLNMEKGSHIARTSKSVFYVLYNLAQATRLRFADIKPAYRLAIKGRGSSGTLAFC